MFRIAMDLLLKAVKYQLFGISLGCLFLIGLASFQFKLIYPPFLNNARGYCATPDDYEVSDYELVHLKTEDGETLQCYLLKHSQTSPTYVNKTVLILTSNDGNIGHSLPLVSIFYKTFGYNVFIYSYRGYGKSTGKVLEDGLKLDAQRVMKYLTAEDEQYQQSSIILYGRSLGGAVAIYIAATMSASVQGMILENTFLSIRKTIPHVAPYLKCFWRFLCHEWDLEKLVPLIPTNIPVLLLSARKDKIVPPSHMDTFNKLFESEQKSFVKFEDSSHNDTVVQPDYWESIQDFIKNEVNSVGY